MSSVRSTIEEVNATGRAALICYLPAGYPDLETSTRCLVAAAESGADVLEIGFPFSDPIMDGPIIQSATQHALDAGYRVADFLDVARHVSADADVPTVVMTYYTIPDTRGLKDFARDAARVGLAGAILPDLPAGESRPWCEAAEEAGLETVFLASSVSTDDRLQTIADASTGFVYAVGLLGVTGVKTVEASAQDLVARVRAHAEVPVCVGVGIKTPEQAEEVAGYADGVIVGSALVQAVGDGPIGSAPARVRRLVRGLRRGVEAGASR